MTTVTTNPYQEVIDWLQSPEGERWSEERIDAARNSSRNSLVTYSARCVAFYEGGLAGVFSFKPQSFYTEESFGEHASG